MLSQQERLLGTTIASDPIPSPRLKKKSIFKSKQSDPLLPFLGWATRGHVPPEVDMFWKIQEEQRFHLNCQYGTAIVCGMDDTPSSEVSLSALSFLSFQANASLSYTSLSVCGAALSESS